MSRTSSPANKSLLGGSSGPETGVRGIPSPFINLDERGRDTPHPSLLPLVPLRKDLLDELLAAPFGLVHRPLDRPLRGGFSTPGRVHPRRTLAGASLLRG